MGRKKMFNPKICVENQAISARRYVPERFLYASAMLWNDL